MINTKEFIKNINEEWHKINPIILESLINSMPTIYIIQKVIDNDGDIIMY